MIIDQDEIEALLTQAEDLARQAEQGEGGPGMPLAVEQPPASSPAPPPIAVDSPEVARLLKIRVPVIVQLASRRMSIAAIRRLSLGMIIEFHKNVDEPLDLLINNRPIGRGVAVKVGEHFGLNITEIGDTATRIRSMGR